MSTMFLWGNHIFPQATMVDTCAQPGQPCPKDSHNFDRFFIVTRGWNTTRERQNKVPLRVNGPKAQEEQKMRQVKHTDRVQDRIGTVDLHQKYNDAIYVG